MNKLYPSKYYQFLFIACLLSLTVCAQVTPGQISFSTSQLQDSYQDCNASVTPIYDYISPTGNYLVSWEIKVGTGHDWSPTAGSLLTIDATVQQNDVIYYRRKVTDKNDPANSSYSNEVYTYAYPADHGAIHFQDGTLQSTVAVGDMPPLIVNETSGSVTHPPIRYQYEKKTGINGTWERVSNYSSSNPATPFQPPSPSNTTDTVYYRRYLSDALCGSIPGGTVPVSVVGKAATLPVHWISATVVKESNSVEVQWKVANEFNNSHFDVSRSNDGVTFTKIGTVATKGNSTSTVSYSFVDPQANGSVLYYRIKQVDKDDKFDLSPVLQIKPNRNNVLELLPNPVTSITTLKGGDIIKQVTITDLAGRTIYSSLNHSSTILIDATAFSKGTYIIKAWLANDEQKTVKMIKQ